MSAQANSKLVRVPSLNTCLASSQPVLRQVYLFSDLLMLAPLQVHTASAPLHRPISLYMLYLIPYHYQRKRALFTQERNRAPVIKATRIIISIIPTTPLRPCYNTPCVCTLGVFALS